MWTALIPILKAAGMAAASSAATSAASKVGSKISDSLLGSDASFGFNPTYMQDTASNVSNIMQKTPAGLQNYLPTTSTKSIYDRIFEELYKSKMRNL